MKNIPASFMIMISYVSATIYLISYIHPLYSLLFFPVFILSILDGITSSSNGNILYIRTIWYLLTGRIKRVKTAFGRFYITNRSTSNHVQLIELYQDKFFYMKEIGHHSYDTTEDLKAWIKGIYDKKYQEKEAIKSKAVEIKKWNGYIDIQHERDSKIKEVIK